MIDLYSTTCRRIAEVRWSFFATKVSLIHSYGLAKSLWHLIIRVALSALDLRYAPHGSVKPIHHDELEDGDKERSSAFPKIMLEQTDSGIQ